MTVPEALREQLKAMIVKAERSLGAAKDHLTKGDADFASSKAYYAVFHLMQAALLTQGKTYSKHAGVISGFSEEFIRKGTVPKEFGEGIQRLRKDRETGDYSYQLGISSEEASNDIKMADRILESLMKVLKPWVSG